MMSLELNMEDPLIQNNTPTHHLPNSKFLSSIGEKDSEYFSKIPENFPNKLSGDFSKLFYSVSCLTRTVSHNVKRVPKSVKCFLLNSKYEVCQIIIMNYVPLNIKC